MTKQLSKKGTLDVARRLLDVPVLTPRDMEKEMIRHGFRGQPGRRDLCTYAYRHIMRLRRTIIEGVAPERLPPREHLLCLGPTGCGKSFAATTLFGKILGLPTVVVNITEYSETGYVGRNTTDILADLWREAGLNTDWMSTGIIILDELDKIASRSSVHTFAGGSNKDVSGYGVQREILHLLSGEEGHFNALAPPHRGPQENCITSNIAFVGCGAFSDLDQILKNRDESLGFSGTPRKRERATGVEHPGSARLLEALREYGFMPEFLGRFANIVLFEALSRDVLREILVETMLPSYREEFELEGVELHVTDEAIDWIIDEALTRGTGARGLRASLSDVLPQAAFELFGRDEEIAIEIVRGDNGLETQVCQSSETVVIGRDRAECCG